MSGYVCLALVLIAAMSLIAYRAAAISKVIEETAPDGKDEE